MTAVALWPSPALAEALGQAVDDVVIIDGSMDTAGVTSADWSELVDDVMWRTLRALQSAHTSMLAQGGRIVLILPTIGFAGAAELSACTTALEGIRAMAKSAARQWGSAGIAVNMVAAPARLFTASPDIDTHLSAPAVPADDRLVHSVVETTRFLLRDDIAHLTGDTVIVDGGSVMLP